MKIKQILLLFILFTQIINQKTKVINSCGNGFKLNQSMPKDKDDCKDNDEGFCKFVKIIHKDGNETRFCAVIHGNYDSHDVLNDVQEIINVSKIEVLGSHYLIGRNSMISIIFFYLLIFLF